MILKYSKIEPKKTLERLRKKGGESSRGGERRRGGEKPILALSITGFTLTIYSVGSPL